MSTWKHIADVLLTWGPYGLLVLSTADSAGIPVVGGVDALLIAVAINKPHAVYVSAICAIVGSIIGSAVLFALARRGGEMFLAKHVSGGLGKRLHSWFRHYGLITVFVPAVSPIPMPMKIPVFCSGALGVRWSNFLSVLLLARTVRYLGLGYLGLHYGRSTFQFLAAHWVIIAAIAFAISILGVLVVRWFARQNAMRRKAAAMAN